MHFLLHTAIRFSYSFSNKTSRCTTVQSVSIRFHCFFVSFINWSDFAIDFNNRQLDAEFIELAIFHTLSSVLLLFCMNEIIYLLVGIRFIVSYWWLLVLMILHDPQKIYKCFACRILVMGVLFFVNYLSTRSLYYRANFDKWLYSWINLGRYT